MFAATILSGDQSVVLKAPLTDRDRRMRHEASSLSEHQLSEITDSADSK